MLHLLLVALAHATTITFKLGSHERYCLYAYSKIPNEKIAFYFAVQAGGDFDVDYDVLDPNNAVLINGNAETSGDFAFTAMTVGEYSFCFGNSMSSVASKNVDVDITVEHESRFSTTDTKSDLEESVGKINAKDKSYQKLAQLAQDFSKRLQEIDGDVGSVERMVRLFRAKEHRNIAMVKSLQSRLFWIAVLGSTVMIAMAVGQVFAIQMLFSKGGRARI